MDEQIVVTLPRNVEDPNGKLAYSIEEALNRVLYQHDLEFEVRVEWAR